MPFTSSLLKRGSSGTAPKGRTGTARNATQRNATQRTQRNATRRAATHRTAPHATHRTAPQRNATCAQKHRRPPLKRRVFYEGSRPGRRPQEPGCLNGAYFSVQLCFGTTGATSLSPSIDLPLYLSDLSLSLSVAGSLFSCSSFHLPFSYCATQRKARQRNATPRNALHRTATRRDATQRNVCPEAQTAAAQAKIVL